MTTPPVDAKPAIVVLHDQPDDLTRTLRRRFGADYEVQSAQSESQLWDLVHLKVRWAVVLADRVIAGHETADTLAALRRVDADVIRCILVPAADRAVARSVHRAVAYGCADRTLAAPWGHPDVLLYPAVSSMLGQWWRKVAPDLAIPFQVTVVAPATHPRLPEMRDLADRNNVHTRFVAPTDAAGKQLLAEAGARADSIVVAAFGKRPLVNPTVPEIGSLVGARVVPPSDQCDLLVVGAGPSGLAAAVYGASEGLTTMILEERAIGGQAGTSSAIKNYPGFPHGISGTDLSSRMVEQVWIMGAESVYRSALSLHPDARGHRVLLDGGSEIAARTVVLATGVQYRRLEAPGIERLHGAGVYHGAARAEAPVYVGKDVYVVGGGNSAGQAAIHLAQYARRVTITIRGESVATSMSDYLLREIERTPNIAVRTGSQIIEAHGAHRLEGLSIRSRDRTSIESADAVFIMIGAVPETSWLPDELKRDDYGYIVTGAEAWPAGIHPPLPYETNLPGLFAVGDVRNGSLKRVATAVGEGAVCIVSVHEYLARVATEWHGTHRPKPPATSGATGRAT